MVSFPNAKINLGLHIVEKRNDGYHNLETVFYPIPLNDVLEIITAPTEEAVALTMSGLPVAGDPSTNLCVKAWQLLKADFPQLPAVQLHLHKNIPMGAGLGGGSSDGSATLKLLNEKYQLGLSVSKLADYALQLGSDCPFFIYNNPMFATGRGEIFEPVALNLETYSFVIVNPGLHISTAQAFSRIKPAPAPVQLPLQVSQPVAEWKNSVRNDFEDPAFFYHPQLRAVKDWLYKAGAVYASMTGSGSCFYGIFDRYLTPDAAGLRDHDPSWQLSIVPPAKS